MKAKQPHLWIIKCLFCGAVDVVRKHTLVCHQCLQEVIDSVKRSEDAKGDKHD